MPRHWRTPPACGPSPRSSPPSRPPTSPSDNSDDNPGRDRGDRRGRGFPARRTYADPPEHLTPADTDQKVGGSSPSERARSDLHEHAVGVMAGQGRAGPIPIAVPIPVGMNTNNRDAQGRARRGAGSIRERRPGVWEIRVVVANDLVAGRSVQRSFTMRGDADSAEARRRKLVERFAVDRSALCCEGARWSVAELLDRGSAAEHQWRPATRSSSLSVARFLMDDGIGRGGLAALSPGIVEAAFVLSLERSSRPRHASAIATPPPRCATTPTRCPSTTRTSPTSSTLFSTAAPKSEADEAAAGQRRDSRSAGSTSSVRGSTACSAVLG
jgi:hypothetical protein